MKLNFNIEGEYGHNVQLYVAEGDTFVTTAEVRQNSKVLIRIVGDQAPIHADWYAEGYIAGLEKI